MGRLVQQPAAAQRLLGYIPPDEFEAAYYAQTQAYSNRSRHQHEVGNEPETVEQEHVHQRPALGPPPWQAPIMEEHESFNRRAVDVIGEWSDSPDKSEFMGTRVRAVPRRALRPPQVDRWSGPRRGLLVDQT